MILNKLIIIFIENKKGGEYLPPNLNAFILLTLKDRMCEINFLN